MLQAIGPVLGMAYSRRRTQAARAVLATAVPTPAGTRRRRDGPRAEAWAPSARSPRAPHRAVVPLRRCPDRARPACLEPDVEVGDDGRRRDPGEDQPGGDGSARHGPPPQ